METYYRTAGTGIDTVYPLNGKLMETRKNKIVKQLFYLIDCQKGKGKKSLCVYSKIWQG